MIRVIFKERLTATELAYFFNMSTNALTSSLTDDEVQGVKTELSNFHEALPVKRITAKNFRFEVTELKLRSPVTVALSLIIQIGTSLIGGVGASLVLHKILRRKERFKQYEKKEIFEITDEKEDLKIRIERIVRRKKYFRY